MHMLDGIRENDVIRDLTHRFRRSSLQINGIHESDAEIVRLSSSPERYLAITTDGIVEEIDSGLYEDPYLIGWMAVMVNLSDLAAVGANPVGVLICEILKKGMSPQAIDRLQEGISDACAAAGTFVLGGDTNFSDRLTISGCAVGTIDQGKPLTRIGCSPGEALYSTGPLGTGNAYALVKLLQPKRAPIAYRPLARLRECLSLRGIATACMDTSDGVLATLDQLMRLNGFGFHVDPGWEALLQPEARAALEEGGVPEWLLLAGQHGEFELLFTLEESNEQILLARAERDGWKPMRLGSVVRAKEIVVPVRGREACIDTARIRNLAQSAETEVSAYLSGLLAIDHDLTTF
jgi:thiamine-monophosphate kinase